MNILLICIFACQTIISSLTTANIGTCQKSIYCEFSKGYNVKYKFNIADVPEQCDVVVFGWYHFEMLTFFDNHIMEFYKNILRALMKNNKIVYVLVKSVYEDDPWSQILDWECKGDDYKNTIDPLKQFINKWNISGIIITNPPIYDINQAENKLKIFVEDMKGAKADLKVGLSLSSTQYKNFPCNDLFDFNKANCYLDFYMIQLTLNDCDENTKYCSMNPISSTNQSVLTLEMVTNNVLCSAMDPCKIIGRVQLGAVTMDTYEYYTYSKYCSANENTKSTLCSDTSKTFYNQGKFVSEKFSGISLSQLPTDDYDGNCNCKKFPVTNLIIDGWLGKTFNFCPALDKF